MPPLPFASNERQGDRKRRERECSGKIEERSFGGGVDTCSSKGKERETVREGERDSMNRIREMAQQYMDSSF